MLVGLVVKKGLNKWVLIFGFILGLLLVIWIVIYLLLIWVVLIEIIGDCFFNCFSWIEFFRVLIVLVKIFINIWFNWFV